MYDQQNVKVMMKLCVCIILRDIYKATECRLLLCFAAVCIPQSLSEAANTLGEYVISQVISFIVIEAFFLRLCIQMPPSFSQQLIKFTVC